MQQVPLEGLSPGLVQQPTNQNENEVLNKLDISFKLKVMSKVFQQMHCAATMAGGRARKEKCI